MDRNYSQELQELLSEAIFLEHSAFYFYLSVGAYFDSQRMSLPNIRDFFYKESDEELTHGKIIIKFMNRMNLHWTRKAIETIDPMKMTIVEVFEKTKEFEQKVLDNFLAIQKKASDYNDFSTTQFIDFFIELQIKEVKGAHDNLMNAVRCESPLGYFLFDQSFVKK